MQVFSSSSHLPDQYRGAVVAIGNFDAVHRGHVHLLAQAKAWADDLAVPCVVLTFEPHPRRLFRPDDLPFRVTPISLKQDLLARAGVDAVVVLPFDWELAQLSPQGFMEDILRGLLGARHLVVGQDFHFGHNRSGSVALLRESGFDVKDIPLMVDGQHGVISATRVRGLIQSGHIQEAGALLGWPWEVRGEVIHGDKRGRDMGYPTANMMLHDTIHPAYGVYATRVLVAGEDVWRMAATNIGIRPMFEVRTGLMEAHILDFSGDLYGTVLRVRLVHKIRDEMKFETMDQLISQIENDCDQVRDMLMSQPG